MKYEIALDEGRKTATLTVGSETFQLNGNDLMQVIYDLAGIRGKMLPEIPGNVQEMGGKFPYFENPAYAVQESDAAVAIAVRTEPFGWLGFLFNGPYKAQLIRALTTGNDPTAPARLQ